MRLRQITTAVSDGTGLPEETVWVGAVVVFSAATVYGIVRAADAVLNLGLTKASGGGIPQ
jgi:hypothetical protein